MTFRNLGWASNQCCKVENLFYRGSSPEIAHFKLKPFKAVANQPSSVPNLPILMKKSLEIVRSKNKNANTRRGTERKTITNFISATIF